MIFILSLVQLERITFRAIYLLYKLFFFCYCSESDTFLKNYISFHMQLSLPSIFLSKISYSSSLELYRRRRLPRAVIQHPVYPLYFIDNPAGDGS